MTRVGTSYFVSKDAAIRYYRPYGYDDVRETVERKLRDGEIHIGKPTLLAGQRLALIDESTRWAVEEG